MMILDEFDPSILGGRLPTAAQRRFAEARDIGGWSDLGSNQFDRLDSAGSVGHSLGK